MQNNNRFILLLTFISLSIMILGCCDSKYSYYICRQKGEEALLAKKYKKAQNYYSIIYTNESKNEVVDKERTTWAFYRLGVIAEVTGDLKMAKGYYWGDDIDDGFYAEQPLVNWFAQAGWNQLDEKNCPRTLEEILEFEKTTPPENDDENITERKKEVIIPKQKLENQYKNNSGKENTNGVITKTYNKSKNLPPNRTPLPMKVYY